ncbi:MAG: TonB-dependent receptor plug domain-containing protein [Hoylesella buccalis]
MVTDIDGNYSLTTKETAPTLEFSYIGYAPQTLVATGATLNVTLSEESSTLNEVVVTAMGIQRKEKSLTYATQQVKAEDLMRVQDPNAVNSLEGKVSGVVITPSAGGAGGASKIILRGNKSVLGNSSPLIVLDGVPMSNGTRGQINGSNIEYSGVSEGADPLSMINPDDIESMNVLKGANAAALYGSAAANGVVMITTKERKGRKAISKRYVQHYFRHATAHT